MARLVHNVQKKQHRERSQPGSRGKFGLLEKKKDYQLRAKNFHEKQTVLKGLKKKALERNPDEYYHGMVNKKTDSRGILISERDSEVLSTGQVKLLKTQDVNYIKTLRSQDLQNIKRLENNLVFKSNGKHTVFVEDLESKENFDAAEYFQTDRSLLESKENRLRTSQLTRQDSIVKRLDEEKVSKESLDKKKLKKFVQLQNLLKREKELREVEERMEIQRNGMSNGNKKKIVDATGRAAFKFKKERKR